MYTSQHAAFLSLKVAAQVEVVSSHVISPDASLCMRSDSAHLPLPPREALPSHRPLLSAACCSGAGRLTSCQAHLQCTSKSFLQHDTQYGMDLIL